VAIKVSIIEDDDWIRENLADQIRLAGLSLPRLLPHRRRALEHLIKEVPDVVLMTSTCRK